MAAGVPASLFAAATATHGGGYPRADDVCYGRSVRRHRWLRVLCWVVLAVNWVGPARAGADDYQSTIDEAVREYAVGNFVEARSLFEHAHALRPSARTWRALGFCAYELKRYVQAMSELDAALDDYRNPMTPDQRREANETRAKAERYVAELRLEIEPENARVLLDGKAVAGRSLRVDAGEHVLSASAEGHRSRDLTLTLVGGRSQAVQLVLPPIDLGVELPASAPPSVAPSGSSDSADSASLTERWWFWAAIGGVVVAGAIGAWAAVSSDQGSPEQSTTGVTLQAPR